MTASAAAKFAAFLVASVVASATFASTAHSLDVKLVTESGKSPDDIYVTLTCGAPCDSSESPPRLRNGKAKQLSKLKDDRFSLASGLGGVRIWFSYDEPLPDIGPQPTPDTPIRYDWVEITTSPGAWGNLTAVDQFAIPLDMRSQDSEGKVLGHAGFRCQTDQINGELFKIPGARDAVKRDGEGNLLRVISPVNTPNFGPKRQVYPDFAQYVASLEGKTMTLKGEAFLDPLVKYDYTGTITDGALTLTGSMEPNVNPGIPPNSDPPSATLSIPLTAKPPLRQQVYSVDGPYSVDGKPPHGVLNDVYGAMYDRLISGFAWGYWGSKYGNDSSVWAPLPPGVPPPPFADARTTPVSFAAWHEYAAVFFKYSDAYGFGFSDSGPNAEDLQVPTGDPAVSLRVKILSDQGPSPSPCNSSLQSAPDQPASCPIESPNLIVGSSAGENHSGSPSSDLIHARGGGDVVVGFGGADCLYGADGRDVLRGKAEGDSLFGQRKRDTLNGASGSVRLVGGPAGDGLRGGNDKLKGGKGNDLLRGGRGTNTISCGVGTDYVVVAAGASDRIAKDCERVKRL